jgi:hypothetical protein
MDVRDQAFSQRAAAVLSPAQLQLLTITSGLRKPVIDLRQRAMAPAKLPRGETQSFTWRFP